MILQDPDARLESPWECSIRRVRGGYIVSWYSELTDSKEPLYRLEEHGCETIEEAYGIAAEYLGEFNTCAYRSPNDE